MSSLAVKIFHLSAVGFYLFVFNYFLYKCSLETDDPRIKTMEKFAYRFLTNWTFLVQLLYFATCVAVDFLSIIQGTAKLRNKVDSLANTLFTTIAGPIAFVVSLTFWLIYALDRELVYPRWIDQVLPFWMNHCFHSFNSLFPLIESLVVNHKFSPLKSAAKVIGLYMGAYGVCLYGTYYNVGVWIYPLLNKLSWSQQGVMTLLFVSLSLALYSIFKSFNRLVWGNKVDTTKHLKPKKINRPKSKKSL